ncbi:FeoA family protein [Opitutales bacterium ASA1]|uniref:FeoA family protein n=1 Tax=Congregicoccus parvus TaxID=3081749 RepID=UPI002B3106ED|nr:FeoA family protein [Opitutales bacterium ASA1]
MEQPNSTVSVRLSSLAAGATAQLRKLPAGGTTFLRLREMGLLPGTKIKLVRRAPLGDPIEIEVRGYHLTLRKEEADLIEVAPC